MSNSSLELRVATKWEVFRHGVYVCQGLASFLFNSLIVATIARHFALRYSKEYIGLGAAAAADALVSLGTLCGGLYRIPVWLSSQHQSPASRRFCLFTPQMFLWVFFQSASYSMLVVLSLDRVLSVAIPLRHHSLPRKYILGLISVAYGMSFVSGVYFYAVGWSQTEPLYTKICWVWYAKGKEGQYVTDILNTGCTFVSIGLYLLIPIFYWYRKNVTNPGQNQEDEAASARAQIQKQLNKSVLLSCMFTFVFVALRWTVRTVIDKFEVDEGYYVLEVTVWMFIVSNFDPMVNLYIYYKKQVYFRKAFKAMLQNKTLPGVLANWNISGQSRRGGKAKK